MSPFCVTSRHKNCSDFVNVIRGSHGCAYATYFQMGCDAMRLGRQAIASRRNLLLPYTEWKGRVCYVKTAGSAQTLLCTKLYGGTLWTVHTQAAP
jgi:hypothetical protein